MPENKIIDLFVLNTSSGIPIYRQLVDQVKQAIQLGLLKEQQRLPSVRQLAKALQINPMTISKAFAQLELEQVLDRKRGVGMLVALQPEQNEISEEVSTSLANFIEAAKHNELDNEAIMLLLQQALSINTQGGK